jgi:hypothetical protein
VITVFAEGVGAHNLPDARAMRRSGELHRILADPAGWHELTGAPWRPEHESPEGLRVVNDRLPVRRLQ